MKKKLLIGLAVVVALLILVAGLISWKASESLLNPDDDPAPVKPTGMQVDDVTFDASDGVHLSGWFIPAPCAAAPCAPAPAIVLSHGRGGNRGNFTDEIPLLHENGYALLAFDYRGMGQSQNVMTTAGAHEQLDLDAAVAFVRGRDEVKKEPVGVIGKSLGATIAMLTAADNQNIGPVVDESGFAKLSDVVSYNFKEETGLPAFPLAPLSVKLAEERAGVDLDSVDAQRTVAQISPRPLLVIHARNDQRVRYDQSEKIFASAAEPKEFWTLEGTDEHAESIKTDPAGYRQHVLPFLQRSLPR